MIREQRSATIKAGKTREALEWAKEVVEYLNQNYPEQHCEALREVWGSRHGRLCFFTDVENGVALAELARKRARDENLLELTQKGLTLMENDWERIALQSF